MISSEFEFYTQFFFPALLFIVGLLVGSFLNVVGLRLLSETSVIFPASHCTKCKTPIAFYDNIPVLSYLFLFGRCRQCKETIHWQYPAIELLTGTMFYLTYMSFGISFKTFFFILLISAMIVILITDFREKLIYDVTSIPLIPLGLVYNFFNLGHIQGTFTFPMGLFDIAVPAAFISAVLGIILGIVFFEGFSYLGYWVLGEHAFGGGDTKLAAGLGAFLGWKALLLVLFLSLVSQVILALPTWLYSLYKNGEKKSFYSVIVSILASALPFISTKFINSPQINLIVLIVAFVVAIIAIVILLQSTKERKSFTFFPFGPAIVLGAVITMFWGEQLINWYLIYIKATS